MKKRKKSSIGDILLDIFVYTLLIGLSIVTILPFLQVITVSLSPSEVVSKFGLHLLPTKISFEGYKAVLKYQTIWIAYKNTIIRTLLGTLLNIIMTILGAYPLSKRYLPNRKLWTGIIVFTMYFSGGLIPSYILVTKLGLYNTMGSLLLPGAISAFTLIITRNFFMTLPESVEESARIDGANDIYIMFKIVLPLSLPIIATISLWYGVGHWNSWFDCMLYINKQSKFVLQYVLRLIILNGTTQDFDTNSGVGVNSDAMKMAALLIGTLPIICAYPFIQKYFVKGVVIGAVKG